MSGPHCPGATAPLSRRHAPGRWRAALASGLVACACALPAAAQEAPVDFGRLSAAQRSTLAPLQPLWQDLTPFQRQKWLEMAQRLPTLAPDERERVRSRMVEWARMSPSERRQARLQFQDVRQQIGPAELQQRWAAYQGLGDDERAALATRSATARAAPAAAAPGRSGVLATATAPPRTSKQNQLTRAQPVATQPVAPALVRAAPGASTLLLSKAPAPALVVRTDQPRVNATPGFVDATTLLPRRGVQGAAVVAPAQAAQLQLALQALREAELAEAAAEAAAAQAAAASAPASSPTP